MDRSGWKAQTAEDAISLVRLRLRAIGSAHSEASYRADLLEYVDEDGVWMVVPNHKGSGGNDVSASVNVITGEVELGYYQRAYINIDLSRDE